MKKTVFILLLSICLAAFSQQAEKKVRFFKPAGGWAVEMQFERFTIVDARSSTLDDFKATLFDEKSGAYVDIYFERGTPETDYKKIRSFYESNLEMSGSNRAVISRWETDSSAFLVYTAKNVLINPVGDELNGDMYFCMGSTWVDVRFRKPYPEKDDQKRVVDFLKSVKIKKEFEPAQEDNVFMGNLYCFSGFQDGCLRCLQQAYQSDKQHPMLSREARISMIENYSNILRIKGERTMAITVLDHGLASDPEYPMYYWNKARVFGEMGEEEKTIEMLAQAVRFRKNLIPGNKLPDPRQDDSFKILGLKESFREKVKKIFFPEEKSSEEKGKGVKNTQEIK